jgi:hypothetical protein
MDLPGRLPHLARIQTDAAVAAAVAAEDRSASHAATAERAMDAPLGKKISLVEPVSHHAPLFEYVLIVFNAPAAPFLHCLPLSFSSAYIITSSTIFFAGEE